MGHVNMNIFLKGILLTLLLAAFNVPQTEATVTHILFKNDTHPGKCYIRADLIMNLGDTKNPDTYCSSITCEDNSMAEIHFCSVVGIADCTLGAVKFPDAAYPKCCEREIICPNDEEKYEWNMFF